MERVGGGWKKIILCLYRDRGRVARNETAKFMTLPKRRKKESSKQPVSSSRRRRTSSVFARYSVLLFLFSWRPVLFIYLFIFTFTRSPRIRSARPSDVTNGALGKQSAVEKNRQSHGSYAFIAYETYVHPCCNQSRSMLTNIKKITDNKRTFCESIVLNLTRYPCGILDESSENRRSESRVSNAQRYLTRKRITTMVRIRSGKKPRRTKYSKPCGDGQSCTMYIS